MKRLWVFLVICLILLSPVFSFAKDKPASNDDIVKVYASTEKEENTADKAVDGNMGSRWESEHKQDPSWIALKLSDKRMIQAIRISWEAAAGAVYQIEVSNNGDNWKAVKKINNGVNGEQRIIKFDNPLTTKYIRIYAEKRTLEEYGYSIWEIALNPIVIEDGKKVGLVSAEASSQTADGTADKAIDGDPASRWESEHDRDPSWIMVKLDKKTKISKIGLVWETAAAKDYKIQVSNDKSTWKDVAAVTDGKPGELRIIKFDPVEAQYLRIYGEKRFHEWWGYSIFEISVYE